MFLANVISKLLIPERAPVCAWMYLRVGILWAA